MGQTYSSTDDIGASGHDYSICGIVVVAPKSGDASLVELRHLPKEARIIGTGRTLEELEANAVPLHMGNIILNVSGNRDTLGPIIQAMPNLTWIHSTTAGVEHLLCADIMENPNITLTNARGVFSRCDRVVARTSLLIFTFVICLSHLQFLELLWQLIGGVRYWSVPLFCQAI